MLGACRTPLKENYNDTDWGRISVIVIACWCRVGSVQSCNHFPRQTEALIAHHFTVKFFLFAAEMIQLWQTLGLSLVLSVGTSTSSSSRQFLPLFDRDPRSLRDTFPFSAQSNDITATDLREDRQVKGPWVLRSSKLIVNFIRIQPLNNLSHSLKWLLHMLRERGEEIKFNR